MSRADLIAEMEELLAQLEAASVDEYRARRDGQARALSDAILAATRIRMAIEGAYSSALDRIAEGEARERAQGESHLRMVKELRARLAAEEETNALYVDFSDHAEECREHDQTKARLAEVEKERDEWISRYDRTVTSFVAGRRELRETLARAEEKARAFHAAIREAQRCLAERLTIQAAYVLSQAVGEWTPEADADCGRCAGERFAAEDE